MNFGNIDVKRTLSFLKKKPVLLLASLVLLVTFVIGGTVAWIVDTTEPVVNTFLPTKVEITVDEDFDQVEKKNVRITNTGDVDAYVRATIVMNWVDGGNVLVKAPEGAPTVAMPTPINGWFIADDGFWYYPDVVKQGTSSAVMFAPVTVTIPDGATYTLHMDILAEGIQAEPDDAVESAWPEVKVNDSNNKLIKN